MRPTVIGLVLVAAVTTTCAAQGGSPGCWVRGDRARLAERPSPLDSAATQVGDATFKVCYGRPSARGRQVIGGLVPKGEPWRLGANEATTIHVPVAALIGGVRVAPGTYSLYAIAGDTTWQIVLNRTAQRWGIPIGDPVRAQDVGAAMGRVEALDQPIETLTLRFAPATGDATELLIEWDRTRVRIPVRRVAG